MLIFLKLGGSLITDKMKVEHARLDVVERLAKEVGRVWGSMPNASLILGHGSGSFGHVVAARYGTRQGAHSPGEWRGFAEVAAAASKLNRIVLESLLASGVPAMPFQPSASAQCEDGEIVRLAVQPLRDALAAGLLPIVHGDVAFDSVRGATIISTEAIMSYLAVELRPDRILLAGKTAGVMNSAGQVVPLITRQNIAAIKPMLGGSHGTDVTGGMVSKVMAMLDLASALPDLNVLLFSGVPPGEVENALLQPSSATGTVIRNSVLG
jgi:isopentenyl phosphate kinase